MKYNDSIERSTDLLRQAVPLMSRQSTALHPLSYALWYAYVREPDSALRRAVDEHIRQHGGLDEAATEALFHRHLADPASDSQQRLVEGMQRLLTGMSDTAALASDETARYGQTLSRLSQELDTDALPSLDEARSHTSAMQSAVQQLQQRLDDSQREINTLREEVRRTRTESLQDSLTGLANRRAFDERVAAEIATTVTAERPEPPCLLMIDIDHFKRINDRLGHAAGDAVLCEVARTLKAQAREVDRVARYGGEEFCVLLPHTEHEGAMQAAERLRAAVSQISIPWEDETLTVTVSTGMACARDTKEHLRSLLRRADEALYRAKAEGRNRVVVCNAARAAA